jgi:hypothetical protein
MDGIGCNAHEQPLGCADLDAGSPPCSGQALALSRAHWGIENRLHYVRDVSCREDQARTHAGHAPQVLAAFRNTTLTIIRRLGFKVVEGFEHFAEHRLDAIEAVRGRRTE